MKKTSSILRKVIIAILSIATIILIIFMLGRYGWKLAGFSACEDAGIETVEVTDTGVHMKGFYAGSFPRGFLGYYAEEKNGELYVGFKFSALFGIFESGDFDITIPVENEITKVIIKTNYGEYSIWPKREKRVDASDALEFESYEMGAYEGGIYIKLKREDVYSIGWSYENESGGMQNADNTPLEADTYLYLDNDIMQRAFEKEKIVPFTLTFYDEMGSILGQAELEFNPKHPLIVATFGADGKLKVNERK